MKIYHSYFSYWLNFQNKRDYCFIAISRTYPQYFTGSIFPKLAPPLELFLNTCEHYNRNIFFPKYANYLKTLDKKNVLEEIYSFSKNNKDIVLLGWEDMSKESDARFAYGWLLGLKSQNEINKFDLDIILKNKMIINELSGDNFLNI
jgi:hypothetical protein